MTIREAGPVQAALLLAVVAVVAYLTTRRRVGSTPVPARWQVRECCDSLTTKGHLPGCIGDPDGVQADDYPWRVLARGAT